MINRLFWHEIQSVILLRFHGGDYRGSISAVLLTLSPTRTPARPGVLLMLGGGVVFDFAVVVHHFFGDPQAIKQGEDEQRDAGPVFDFQEGFYAEFTQAARGAEGEHEEPEYGAEADTDDARHAAR